MASKRVPRPREYHGASRPGSPDSRIYTIWNLMRGRCLCETHPDWKYYGGRGISVCQEWLESFREFKLWATSNGYEDGLTLDRFPDNDGNYEPGNCRWATRHTQNRNTRANHMVTAFGETKCITDWESDSRAAVSRRCIAIRINKGIAPEEAITTSPDRSGWYTKGHRPGRWGKR